jgi:hypothetical protein
VVKGDVEAQLLSVIVKGHALSALKDLLSEKFTRLKDIERERGRADNVFRCPCQ